MSPKRYATRPAGFASFCDPQPSSCAQTQDPTAFAIQRPPRASRRMTIRGCAAGSGSGSAARRRLAAVVLLCATLVASGLVWYGLTGSAGLPTGMYQALDRLGVLGEADSLVLSDMDGRAVVVSPAPDVAGSDVAATGGRFVAPAHGLDVPLLAMTLAGDIVNPPTLTDAFVLRGSGFSTSAGSTPRIITMHAVRGGVAPGNSFFAGGTDVVAASVGDRLYVDGSAYTVTQVEILPQGVASQAASIWGVLPDGEERLVVLTCVQRPGGRGRATENLVLHALRDPGGSGERVSAAVEPAAATSTT